jgi:DNA-directed RNA polymerase beta' subunit
MKLKTVNLNKIYESNKTVTNPETIIPKKNTFTDDGIFSEEIFGKLHNENYQYSCTCGNIKGKFYTNHRCTDCGTLVRFTESNITKFGWIKLSDTYEFINPLFFFLIQKIVPKKMLHQILAYNKKMDVNGNLIDEETMEEEFDYKKNPFINYGLIEFKKNLFKILDFFKENSTSKEIKDRKSKTIKFIKKNYKKVFIKYYPIIPTILRPVVIIQDSLIFDEINNYYNIIITTSNMITEANSIKTKNDLEILPLLYNVQIMLNNIFDKMLQNISGKSGYIRTSLMGTRINFSARSVITPAYARHDIDEVIMPYLTFLELYKFHIINVLQKLKNINYNEALHEFNLSTLKFDKNIYEIIKTIINKTEGGVKILLNRK